MALPTDQRDSALREEDFAAAPIMDGLPTRYRGSLQADDGYLSASEIARLKLDADWVILSSCKTAAGEAKGAEALSGLARAFFYAGSRALLV